LVTGKDHLWVELIFREKTGLDRAKSARNFIPLGAAGFLQKDGKKRIAGPKGKLADLAVLSSDYFSIPEEEIKSLESGAGRLSGGKVVLRGRRIPQALRLRKLPVSPDWVPLSRNTVDTRRARKN